MAGRRQHDDWPRPAYRSGLTGRAGAGGSGGFGGQTGSKARGARVFPVLQAWAAGILVLVITEYLQVTLLYENAVGPRGPQSFGAALALVHLPNLVCVALATWAAARCHPEPHCEEPIAHAIATFTVPVAAQLLAFSVLRRLPGYDALGFWLSTGVLVTGCVIGWAAERWRRHRA